MSSDFLANPPKLKPGEYGSWVVKFEAHVLATNGEVWQVIEQGRKIIPDPSDPTKEKKREDYVKDDFKNIEKTAKALKVLHSALEPGDMQKVIHLRCPKEIWETLKRIYEGSEDVKRNRVLAAQTELLNLKQAKNESIHDFHSRFQGCISKLANLQKTYEQWETNHMFLQGLGSDWNDLVRTLHAMPQVKDLTVEELVAKLDSSMILDKNREAQKPTRQVALASKGNGESKEKNSAEKGKEKVPAEADDELALLTEAFKIAKERRKEGKQTQRSSKRKATKDDECFYCKKKGHFQVDCHKKKRDKKKEAKNSKDENQEDKKAMCAWGDIGSVVGDSDSDLESKYKNSGARDLCLMATEGSLNSEVSSSSDTSYSPNITSRTDLLDLIRRMVDVNHELNETIAEKDAMLEKLFEENHQKTICIRKLENRLKDSEKPIQRTVVTEPSQQRISGPRRKEPKHGLGYGKVTLLQRPKVTEPRTTPHPKVDLEGNAQVYGKGFHIWNKIANGGQSKVVDFNKQMRKAAEWKDMNFRKVKICHHCGQDGHLRKECPGRKGPAPHNKVRKGPAPHSKVRKGPEPCSKAKVPTPSAKKKVSEPRQTDENVKRRGKDSSKTNSYTDRTSYKFSRLNTTPKTTKLVWVPKN